MLKGDVNGECIDDSIESLHSIDRLAAPKSDDWPLGLAAVHNVTVRAPHWSTDRHTVSPGNSR